ncbi:LuxR C-terminal-related transcriptional regulator [Sphingobacterium sp. SGL-16]|uniref:LuxR C-terminal-related transcriptional regulator n=1 Tax=Sphingobacterium sp. SGL-16 TaxID=2710883 RepID=UPI0013ED4DB8|nr:LuxR C-terminal-related transcriptional regulator [Sphingobacterium sp. SGL-16]NGM73454.1 response regulator transcription factor [Sphingobacterium sp. SGL-16]
MSNTDHTLHELSEALKNNSLHIKDIANKIPASLMIHDIEDNKVVKCSYMNDWGCRYLQTTAQEINELGEEYYNRYFFIEEIKDYLQDISKYIAFDQIDSQYNFFQRVKRPGNEDPEWFFTVCKLIHVDTIYPNNKKLIVISSPVIGFNNLINRVNKTLNLEGYIGNNYRKFALLTTREKQILSLLAHGMSTNEIAETLYISQFTVSTHRRNLIKKINCKSSTELLRFAIAFELFK